MAINKVIYDKKVLIDLTSDTVDSGTLLKGTTAHDKSGTKITGTYEKPSGTISITTNGTHVVRDYENAKVDVPIPSGYIKPTGTKSITSNGTHNVNDYQYANVNVQPSLQTKTVTPTKSTQTITNDSSYYGLSKVTVNPIPSNYIIPSGVVSITTNGTLDITNYSSANVNVPTPEKCSVTINKSTGWTLYVTYFDADKNQLVVYDDMDSSTTGMTKTMLKNVPIIITLSNTNYYFSDYTPSVSFNSGEGQQFTKSTGVSGFVITSDVADVGVFRT